MLPKIRLGRSDLLVSALCYGVAGFGTGVRGEEMDRLFGAFRAVGGEFL